MANQTVYTKEMPIGFPGMKSNSRKDDHVRSTYNAEATAEIPFGVVVVQSGTVDPQAVKLPSAAADIVAGVALHSHEYTPGVGIGDIGIKPKNNVNCLAEGECLMRVEEAVAVGDRPFVRFAGAGQKGAIRKTNVAGETVQLMGFMVLSPALAGQLARVRVSANTVRSNQA